MTNAEVNRLLADGLDAQRRGDAAGAGQKYRAVLERQPEQPAALNALGIMALNAGDPESAATYFDQATTADPTAPELWLNLAKSHRLCRNDEAEGISLDRALALDQRHFMANVRKAQLHERRGETGQAMHRWSGVLALAAQIPEPNPAMEDLLGHARGFLQGCSSQLEVAFEKRLEGFGRDLEGAEMRRFKACLDTVLGRRRIYVNECHGLHFPFLPADEFFEREHFSWMSALEAKTDAIRDELIQLLEEGDEAIRPYVQQDPGTPQNKWSGLDHSERWSARFLWHNGIRKDDACARCPETAAALEALPRSDIPGRSPTAFFSLLHPHTRIPPHTGVTNVRAIVHLPLIVPPDCGFRVGGEVRPWVYGQCMAFDDTIEHEAWNDSDRLRAVLIFDVWNPHLGIDEQAMLRALFQEMLDNGLSPYGNSQED